MTALPTTADLTGSTRTNAQMKATHAALRDYLAGLLGEDGTISTANLMLGTLLQGGIRLLSSTTTIVPEDRGKIVNCSGTWTASLPSLAAVGPRWAIVIRNFGSGTITLAANGADLIESAGTVALVPGDAVILISGATGVWMALTLASGVAGGRLLRTADLMTSATDATTGRLAQITGAQGIFGLGGVFGPQLPDLDATSIPTGLYFFNTTSGTVGTNPGFAAGTVIVTQGIGAGTQAPMMIAIERAASAGRMAWRSSQGGVWSAWRTVLGRGDMLGTVSQSGGVPTGALMETGTNANGRYYRYADGRQVCEHVLTATGGATTADGALFRSAVVAWTYPAGFAAVPAIYGDVPSVGHWVQCVARNITSTGGLRVYSTVSNATNTVFNVRAEGRWF